LDKEGESGIEAGTTRAAVWSVTLLPTSQLNITIEVKLSTPPPITGTVTQVFPVKIVPEYLPLLFSGCKYGTKR